MFNDDAPVTLGKGSSPAPGHPKKAPFNWKALPIETLIQYRDEITRCLPALSLEQTNLEEELLLQYQAVRALQSTVINDDEEALNQRAQVANTVSNVLKQLIEMQEKVYTQERFKKIEAAMIRSLSVLPEDVAASFLTHYEAIIKGDK